MGKIVKYCNSCDEGFAEKFGFCPNCGHGLEAFELNPLASAEPPEQVSASPATEADTVGSVEVPTASFADVEEPVETIDEVEPAMEAAPVEEPDVVPVEEPIAEADTSPAAPPAYIQSTPIDIDRNPVSFEAAHDAALSQGGFYVTVIEEKNVKQRNALLLGTLGCMVTALMGLTVYSLFAKDLGVGCDRW